MKEEDNLGIPNSDFLYQRISNSQDSLFELVLTRKFLTVDFLEYLRTEFKELYNKDISIKFINYGDTQLVYVLTVRGTRYAVLANQPATELGIVKREYDNLIYLAGSNTNEIVRPITYFTNEERELYVAPYINQARCIASQNMGWGVYVPEPSYHFKKFSKSERMVVNSSMIALLIKLYDDKRNLGIASCKIAGGDFILEKKWSNENPTLENTLNRMKLVAARELITTDLDDYVDLLRKEFSKVTYYKDDSEKDESIIINHKSRLPMTEEEIEKGIAIGYQLRKDKYDK